MYIMLLGIGALMVVGIYHLTKGRGRRSRRRPQPSARKPLETGNHNGPVDMSWIPEQTLQVLSECNDVFSLSEDSQSSF